ncbi:MAG: pyridoxal-phosphate dependent enzyme, partial [Deltaproteobacteria bacterium]|nr:pyridoxal-phosphate dependent enzyme [Deltaproteobacteria bacterium]
MGNLLCERWPGLGLVQEKLVAGPTPLHLHDSLSKSLGIELWIKREDLSSPIYGGNKVRKLEWLLGEAQAKNAKSIVTVGALGSHHVLATTLFARKRGLEVHALLVPQPWSAHAEETLRLTFSQGAQIHLVRHFVLLPQRAALLVAKLRLQGKAPYLIPAGGSSKVGALGYVEAGIELGWDMIRENLTPDAIFVALGSGGTAAGLAVGLAVSGCTVPL